MVFIGGSLIFHWIKENYFCVNISKVQLIDFPIRNPTNQHLNNVMVRDVEIGPASSDYYLGIIINSSGINTIMFQLHTRNK